MSQTVIEQGVRSAAALGFEEAVRYVEINIEHGVDPMDGLRERLKQLKEEAGE